MALPNDRMEEILALAKSRSFEPTPDDESASPLAALDMAEVMKLARTEEGAEPLNEPELGLQVGQAELGEAGLDMPVLRGRIAKKIGFGTPDAEKLGKAVDKLREQFPKGDMKLVTVQGSTTPAEPMTDAGTALGLTTIDKVIQDEKVVVFRESPDQPYRRLDAGLLESFEPLSDIADVLGAVGEDLGAIAGELAGAAATRGAALPVRLLGTFLSAATGDVAQQMVTSKEPPDLGRAGTQGAFAAVGGEGGEAAIRTGRNMVRGGGVFGTSPEGARAMRSAQELEARTGVEIPEPPAGVTTSNPIISRISRQSAAIVPTINQYVQHVEEAVNRAVRTLKSPQDSAQLRARLTAEEARLRQSLRDRFTTDARVDFEDAGSAIVQAAMEYEQTSQARVSLLYNEAQASTAFDGSLSVPQLQADLEDVQRGVRFLRQQEPEINPIIDPSTGRPFETTQEPELVAERITQLSGDLDRVIGQIRDAAPGLPPIEEIAPDGTTRVVSGLDQLQAWRTQLFDLKTPAPGERFTNQHRLARNAYNAITRAIERGGDGPAWESANRAARLRFETLEETAMQAALKSGDTREFANYAKSLLSPGTDPRQLRVLRRTLPDRDYKQLQNAFKANLLKTPAAIDRSLDQMDEKSVRMLLSVDEESAMRAYAGALTNADRAGISDMALESANLGAALRERIASNDRNFIENLRGLIQRNGGFAGPLANSIRAGIVDDIIHSATRTGGQTKSMVSGLRALDFNEIKNSIDTLNKVGGLNFLRLSDVKTLLNARNVQDILQLASDAGTSIRAAEISADVMEANHSAWLDMGIAYGWGYVMTIPAFRKFLTGSGAEDLPVSTLTRGLAGISTLLSTEISEAQSGVSEAQTLLPASL